MVQRVTKSESEWQRVIQRVIKSDSEWEQLKQWFKFQNEDQSGSWKFYSTLLNFLSLKKNYILSLQLLMLN